MDPIGSHVFQHSARMSVGFKQLLTAGKNNWFIGKQGVVKVRRPPSTLWAPTSDGRRSNAGAERVKAACSGHGTDSLTGIVTMLKPGKAEFPI